MQHPVSVSPDILGGTPVFSGTRVPVQTLLDYLQGGETIEDFLDGFPSVTREQVLSFLDLAKDRCVEAIEQGRECEAVPTGKRIGVAKGKFEVPDDIDLENDEVARLFMEQS
ncbi:MAG: DUF433 domain-containing protein [Burkholderiales bacterium]|nr:DUF433 domain-containing protein [Burkholderiales bacterium]